MFTSGQQKLFQDWTMMMMVSVITVCLPMLIGHTYHGRMVMIFVSMINNQ